MHIYELLPDREKLEQKGRHFLDIGIRCEIVGFVVEQLHLQHHAGEVDWIEGKNAPRHPQRSARGVAVEDQPGEREAVVEG